MFNANVNVFDTISIQDTINEKNYTKICDLISSTDLSSNGLQIIGTVTFDKDPNVEHLNLWPYDNLVRNVWFVNDEYVIFNENIKFQEIALGDSSLITVILAIALLIRLFFN